MSNYTMTLKRVIDVYSLETVMGWFENYDLHNYLTQAQIDVITEADIFSKQLLSDLIVSHYWNREIAYETPYLFRHFVEVKMGEVMERYAPLIYAKSALYLTNPLNLDSTFSVTESTSKTTTNQETINNTTSATSQGSTTSNSTGSGTSLNVNSDTPQGQVTKTDILAGNYATSTSANENSTSVSDTTSTSSSGSGTDNTGKSSSGSETSSHTKSGYDLKMTKADLLINFKKAINSIYSDIIEEFNNCFFALF